MEKDEFITLIAWFVTLIASGMIGYEIGARQYDAYWQDKCIKQGYAIYAPDTGEFIWKDEISDED